MNQRKKHTKRKSTQTKSLMTYTHKITIKRDFECRHWIICSIACSERNQRRNYISKMHVASVECLPKIHFYSFQSQSPPTEAMTRRKEHTFKWLVSHFVWLLASAGRHCWILIIWPFMHWVSENKNGAIKTVTNVGRVISSKVLQTHKKWMTVESGWQS